MMKTLFACGLLLVSSGAMAQQPASSLQQTVEQRIQLQIGQLVGANIVMTAQNEQAQAQIAALTKEVAELKKQVEDATAK